MWGYTCQLYLRICNTPFVGCLSKPNRISCHDFFFMAVSTSPGVLVRELSVICFHHMTRICCGEYHHDIPTGYHINCRGLHTFHLRSPNDDGYMGPFAGNIYSDAFHSTPVHMEVRWEKRGGGDMLLLLLLFLLLDRDSKRRNLFLLNSLEQNTKTHHSTWG